MPSPVDAQIILCDSAVADPGGRVHMLGAGWSVTSSPTPPQAVAVLMRIPSDRADQKIRFSLRLVDSDGAQVVIDSPQGSQEIAWRDEVEVGRPSGLPPGSSLDASFALNVQSMPLAPGRYEWRLEVAETTATASFWVK
jgi:hypothetical protein